MLIGYARVSKNDESQVLDSQLHALSEYGVKEKNIYSDKVSGARDSRPGLDACLKALRKGDKLVIYKLDRLGRSLVHLVETADRLNNNGVALVILADTVLGKVDTSTASGKLMYSIMSAFAEFTREQIRENTRAGLKAARARGRLGGRPAKMTVTKLKMAVNQMKLRNTIATDLAKSIGISRSTLYSYVNSDGTLTPKGQTLKASTKKKRTTKKK